MILKFKGISFSNQLQKNTTSTTDDDIYIEISDDEFAI